MKKVGQKTGSTEARKVRVQSYDVFRGVLLVGMVVFHVIVNLTRLEFNQELFYWVPLGFVLFLGVVLGKFLVGRFGKKIKLSAKLLGIFLLGNVLNFWKNDISWRDFVLGSRDLFSFEILLPMIVVIVLSLLLDKIRLNKALFWGALAGLCLTLIIFQYFGIDSYNLLFGWYGLIGYFAGRSLDLDRILNNRSWRVLIWVFALLFAVIPFLVIQYWQLFDALIVMQVVAMYFLFNFVFDRNRILVVLGKYSLVLYVGHIVLIKILEKL